ncbi:MAG: hypothetical protein WCP34_06160 [Pseudomonadota bacterium]
MRPSEPSGGRLGWCGLAALLAILLLFLTAILIRHDTLKFQGVAGWLWDTTGTRDLRDQTHQLRTERDRLQAALREAQRQMQRRLEQSETAQDTERRAREALTERLLQTEQQIASFQKLGEQTALEHQEAQILTTECHVAAKEREQTLEETRQELSQRVQLLTTEMETLRQSLEDAQTTQRALSETLGIQEEHIKLLVAERDRLANERDDSRTETRQVTEDRDRLREQRLSLDGQQGQLEAQLAAAATALSECQATAAPPATPPPP